VTDAKLATETRAGTILQLCVYSDLLEGLQSVKPENARVVAPHHKFEPETYRLADYGAYHRLVTRRLETALGAANPATYPEPVQHCDVCSWWVQCNARRRKDDHLCFVAGISRLQINELRKRFDVDTLERLGDLTEIKKPKRGSREALERARDQAAIQLKARRLGSVSTRSCRSNPSTASCGCRSPRAAICSSISKATASRSRAAASICSA
jgi:uncharacterized protein